MHWVTVFWNKFWEAKNASIINCDLYQKFILFSEFALFDHISRLSIPLREAIIKSIIHSDIQKGFFLSLSKKFLTFQSFTMFFCVSITFLDPIYYFINLFFIILIAINQFFSSKIFLFVIFSEFAAIKCKRLYLAIVD